VVNSRTGPIELGRLADHSLFVGDEAAQHAGAAKEALAPAGADDAAISLRRIAPEQNERGARKPPRELPQPMRVVRRLLSPERRLLHLAVGAVDVVRCARSDRDPSLAFELQSMPRKRAVVELLAAEPVAPQPPA